jgi:hypothetical protein
MRHGGREVALGRHTEIPGSLAVSRSEQNMEIFMNLAAADVSPPHPEPDFGQSRLTSAATVQGREARRKAVEAFHEPERCRSP